MKNEIAMEIQNVDITYRNLSHMSIHQSIFNGDVKKVQDAVRAVKGISFDVKKGEILGIIGKNGSGKSTLLKAIAGIFKADKGVINIYEKRVALMSIGVGFIPELTGRENIMISGLLLGFSPRFIEQKMNEIIEFSELGDFIEKPVRTYSSGMHSKLSFSVTAMMEPDIMLIDEVLSVGDAKFKLKSYTKMEELINDENRTVIIVSHDTGTLQKICSRVMWMHDGEIRMIGNTDEVLIAYEQFMR